MLYTFKLTYELLNSSALKIKAINTNFLESWRKNGVVVFKKPEEVLKFSRSLAKKIDPKYIQLWNTALTSNLVIFDEELEDIEFILDEEDFNKIFYKKFGCSTIYIDQDTEDLISNYSNYKKYCGKELKEIISIDSYSDSFFLSEADIYSNKQIDSEETLQEIWEKRFKNFFKYNHSITIVDRYLFINEWDSYNRRGNSALLNLFRKLASENIKLKKIEFVSNDYVDSINICDFFERNIWSSSILKNVCEEVKLISKEDSFFKGDFHDRLIRADKHYIEIGIGLGDIFRDPKMKKFTTLTMKPKKPADYESYINSATRIDINNSQEWIKKYQKENPS
ncbi:MULTISPECIES: hypothetical protein [unclassified Acinetobacter]|uniref:hypothetical protein n=1 Tax=unclassified Acinetobacter TaxID=196816 RepID=UPI00190659D4|nr:MULTISPECIES: hypothetical protein [unclassified Acinetobacter]QQN40076.1 hypothetical protein JFY49_03790 [Acinetobacter sp. CS-2]